MRTHKTNKLFLWMSLPFALTSLLLLAGCPEDDAAAMARAISQQGGGGSARSADPPAGRTTQATTEDDASARKPGEKPELPVQTPAVEGEPGEPAQEVTVVPTEIKPPAPRFDGAGRYDMVLDVSVDPPVDEAVWKIVAQDAEGNNVGETEMLLLLLHQEPKTIHINDLYCTMMPVSATMEIALDDKGQPKTAQKAEGSGVAGQDGGGELKAGGQGLGGGGGGARDGGGGSGGSSGGGGDAGGGGEEGEE
jgi:hypothetical protein